MERDRMRRSLHHLGIPLSDVRMLELLPLIYVAWADGKMEQVQKERIHEFAARRYDLSARGAAVLNRWLNERPSHAYISEALHDMFFLAKAPDDMEVDFSELPALISYAEGIARSSAAALDQPETVSTAQDSALEEIARELRIDHGESWGKLLKELRESSERLLHHVGG